ncbi:ABC transporter permease [Rhodococcus koreensis]|uniref:Peptide/nickel transport system permease protein n=1 Tax=Rhodococcus koreensis TaxID=99653 RepID=A0A1H5CAM9_9NOCA|nr:ABC transporter permease [Rhodococcus koreensis]SED63879.1 peptide/nickel transport system permease protein [Rhodococcus koreensis]
MATATGHSPVIGAATTTCRRGVPGLRGVGWLGYTSAAIIALAAVIAVFGPLLAPYPPNQSDLAHAFGGAGPAHPLGYDSQGRDILSRLLVGARSSMLGAFVVIALAMVAGTVLAVTAAWRGGWVDSVTSSGSDLVFAFPGLLLAVLAAAVFGPSQWSAALSLAVAYTPYVARIVRGAAIRERSLPYIEALEVQGRGAWAICVRHIVPNIAPMLVAQGTILFGWAALDLAAISFLGLGVQPPQADWGVMVSEGQTGVLQGFPAESLAAGTALVLVIVAFNILGERLNDRQAKELS